MGTTGPDSNKFSLFISSLAGEAIALPISSMPYQTQDKQVGADELECGFYALAFYTVGI